MIAETKAILNFLLIDPAFYYSYLALHKALKPD